LPIELGVDLDCKEDWEFECRPMSDKIVGTAGAKWVGGCGVVICNFNVVRAVMIFIVEAETGVLWRLLRRLVVSMIPL
jgi:hypothetical protein